MQIQPTKSGGREVRGETPFGDFRVEWSADGELVSHEIIIKQPTPSRPALPIPDDFDPNTEARRTRQGGCCGQPTA